MTRKKNILLAGNGWGAISALKSLLRHQEFEIFVNSDDLDVFSLINAESRVSTFEGIYDVVVCAGWTKKIPLGVLKNQNIINIHYSLLPEYRGLHSVVWAILNDELEIGFTIHRMNQYFDDGSILYQYKIHNDFKSTSVDFIEHFNKQIELILGDVLFKYLQGEIMLVEQDKSKASWVGKRSLRDCIIDFNRSLGYQRAFFRALVKPYPLPYFYYKGEMFEVEQCEFHPSNIETHRGRILNIDGEGVWASCKGGYLLFKRIVKSDEKKRVCLNMFKIGVFLND